MLKVFYFAAGFVVGIICLYLIQTYSTYLSPNAELYGYPKKFGDVTITAFKSTDQQASKGIDKIYLDKDHYTAYGNKLLADILFNHLQADR